MRAQRIPQFCFIFTKPVARILRVFLFYLRMSQHVQALFDHGAQFGYSKTKRHPSVASFIFTSKNRGDIINLEKTSVQLEEALAFLATLANTGKTVLFVGTKPEIREALRSTADAVSMPYVEQRWVGGTLTNFSEIRRRAERLLDLEYRREHNQLVFKTKKERLMIDREIEKLHKNFSGIAQLKRTPDAIVVIDPRHEYIAVNEAQLLNIPVIALANTDCNITGITYPILANDTTRPSVDYIMNTIKDVLKKS